MKLKGEADVGRSDSDMCCNAGSPSLSTANPALSYLFIKHDVPVRDVASEEECCSHRDEKTIVLKPSIACEVDASTDSLQTIVKTEDQDESAEIYEGYVSFQGLKTSSSLCSHTSQNSLLKKKTTVARQDRHVCKTCGKTFHFMGCFIAHTHKHKRSRTSQHPVACKSCGKTFKGMSALLNHNRSHTGERPYSCKSCNRAFKIEGALRRHVLSHSSAVPGQYKCKVCGKNFSHTLLLQEHENHHTNRWYMCQFCNKTFMTKSYLQVHERIHTGERPYVCKVCNRAFNSSSYLRTHERNHYSCKSCNNAFLNLTQLQSHKCSHTTKPPDAPESRNKTFQHKTPLRRHELYHRSERPFTCKSCNMTFDEDVTLQRHQLTQCSAGTGLSAFNVSCDLEGPLPAAGDPTVAADERVVIKHEAEDTLDGDYDAEKELSSANVESIVKPLTCGAQTPPNTLSHAAAVSLLTMVKDETQVEIASTSEESQSLYQSDRKTSKPSKAQHGLSCKYCDVSFRDLSEVKKHRCDLVCKTCDKRFNSLTNLQCHASMCEANLLKRKDVPVKEDCLECKVLDGKELQCAHCLARHPRNHTGKRLPSCNICHKSFLTLGNLQDHLRKHSHVCNFCLKAFQTAAALQSHERRHNCERSHVCNLCLKTFLSVAELKKHERIHTGERPYACKICNKAFVSSYHLRRHERIHTRKGPYACKFCNKMYKQITSLNRHERKHSDEYSSAHL